MFLQRVSILSLAFGKPYISSHVLVSRSLCGAWLALRADDVGNERFFVQLPLLIRERACMGIFVSSTSSRNLSLSHTQKKHREI